MRKQHSIRAGRSLNAIVLGPSLSAFVRARMRLQKEAVASRRHRRCARYGTMRRSPPLLVARPAWHLYAVSGVKDHGIAEILHPRDRTHVADQRVHSRT